MTEIGTGAFYGCNYLADIKLPNRLTAIEDDTFFKCRIHEIEIPPTVCKIGSNAFNKAKLHNIRIPGSVKTIGETAFYSTNLWKVVIEDGVESLEDEAFSWNDVMVSIELPASVTKCGKGVFNGCRSLDKIVAPGIKITKFPKEIRDVAAKGYLENRELYMNEAVAASYEKYLSENGN